MKRRLISIGCVLFLLQACSSGDDNNFSGFIKVIGSGNIVSEVRAIGPFDSVDLRAVADVSFTRGPAQDVRVEVDDNIIGHIITTVLGGVLLIETDADYDTLHGVRISFEIPDVQSLQLTGVGVITGTSIASAGNVSASIPGVGTISLSGTASTFDGTLGGAGTLNAQQLQTLHSTVLLSGVGDCRVHATDQLDATISGTGDIYYAGNPPVVNSTITGLGNLIPI